MEDIHIKHLELIQSIINRMANNSFLIKGWSLTIVVGLLALSAKDSINTIVLIPIFPIIIFWGLDGFFLWQEKLYRALYEDARNAYINNRTFDVFSLSIEAYKNPVTFVEKEKVASWLEVCFSKTLIPFHGVILFIILIIFILTSF